MGQPTTDTQRREQLVCVTLILLGVVILLPDEVLAAVARDNLLEDILDAYRSRVAFWIPAVKRAAFGLFWSLAGIELAWTGVNLALQGADLKEFAAELVRRVLFIGFFLSLLTYGHNWANTIVDSLRLTAASASQAAGASSGMSPAVIFDIGIKMAINLAQAYSIFDPGGALGLAIAALIITIVFALIAAFMVLAYVEMYIVLTAGMILLGLGGSRWTKDFAVKYLTYAFSVGMKLFILQLLLGIGEGLFTDWTQQFGSDQGQVFLVLGGSIVMLALVKSVPDLVQSLITGISVGSGVALPAAAGAAVGGMAGAALRTGGGLAAIQQATKLAQAQGATGVMGVASAAAGNLGRGVKEDMMGRLGGGNRFGTLGGRMAQDMRQQRQSMGEIGMNTIGGTSGGSTGPGSGPSPMPSPNGTDSPSVSGSASPFELPPPEANPQPGATAPSGEAGPVTDSGSTESQIGPSASTADVSGNSGNAPGTLSTPSQTAADAPQFSPGPVSEPRNNAESARSLSPDAGNPATPSAEPSADDMQRRSTYISGVSQATFAALRNTTSLNETLASENSQPRDFTDSMVPSEQEDGDAKRQSE